MIQGQPLRGADLWDCVSSHENGDQVVLEAWLQVVGLLAVLGRLPWACHLPVGFPEARNRRVREGPCGLPG